MDVFRLMDALQKRRRIDLLLAIYTLGEEATWKNIRQHLKEQHRSMCWGAYIEACREFTKLEILKELHTSPKKHQYIMTDNGCGIVSIVEAMVRDIGVFIKGRRCSASERCVS